MTTHVGKAMLNGRNGVRTHCRWRDSHASHHRESRRWEAALLACALALQTVNGHAGAGRGCRSASVPDGFQSELTTPHSPLTINNCPLAVASDSEIVRHACGGTTTALRFWRRAPRSAYACQNLSLNSARFTRAAELRFRDTFLPLPGSTIGRDLARRISSVSFLKKWTTKSPSAFSSQNLSFSTVNSSDSLSLLLLDLAVEKAGIEVTNTSFWRRLIPDVRLSAGIGLQQLAFIDPASFVPYTLPKDSYRITASLSVTDIFNPSQHERALLDLAEKQALRSQALLAQEESARQKSVQQRSLRRKLKLLQEEESLLRQVLEYTQLLFDQGKETFDTLVRTRLQLLRLQQTIQEVQDKLEEL